MLLFILSLLEVQDLEDSKTQVNLKLGIEARGHVMMFSEIREHLIWGISGHI